MSLTKPGIIFGNAITAAAGFFLASKNHSNLFLLLVTLAGLSFVIASACIFNNYLDRDIDEKMTRTKNRALVKKVIPARNALIFATLLGLIGALIFAFYTNPLTLFIALVGFFFYVLLYTPWKRRTVHGTVIGSVSGAVPPVVGYCSVTNHFDIGALILFIILVLWQMPHFYAIALHRSEDYAHAKIPVLPLKKGILVTKLSMLLYISGFIVATCMLTFFGYTGNFYLVVAVLLGLGWLGLSLKGFWATDNKRWSRKMFLFSLIILTTLCFMMAVDVGTS